LEPHVTGAAEFTGIGDDGVADDDDAAVAEADAIDESADGAETVGAALAVADAEGASMPPVSSGTEPFEQPREPTAMRNADDRK
jgi:hypothetical protein